VPHTQPEPEKQGVTLDALARAVRARRQALGLTQEEVADLADCSERFVYMVERGKGTVQLSKLLRVLGVLGLGLRIATGHGEIAEATPGDGP
jgi:HTH-type transcriptional regulator / antitoxin HipB